MKLGNNSKVIRLVKKITNPYFILTCTTIDIRIEILMHLRSTKRNRAEVSLYDPIGVDKEGNEITLVGVLGTDPDMVADLVENHFEQKRLLEKVKALNGREKNVLELRFGLFNGIRKTQKEIARRLGISRSYVSRIEKSKT